MKNWNIPANRERIEKTIKRLEENGIKTYFIENREEAKEKVFEIIPKNSEVMTMTSVTLDTLEILNEINESGKYVSVRKKLNSMSRESQVREMQQIGVAPEWAIGSVQAVTEDGKIMIASNTGSQLSAYVYGAEHVIFIVGSQKIVKNIDEGMKRIYEHSLLLESERARKAYGVEGSSVNKILLINKEFKKDRIHLIFVNEVLGY